MKLQNNFTTTDQSNRLLELGLPADSADMVYEKKQVGVKMMMSSTPDVIPNSMYLSWNDNRIPCWSVGRLIDIFRVCVLYNDEEDYTPAFHIYAGNGVGSLWKGIDTIVKSFEEYEFDFSKLED